MGLTGVLREIATKECPHCNKEYGKHSKKGFMKCLYTANYNLYNVVIELNELRAKQPFELPEKGKVEIADNTTGANDDE